MNCEQYRELISAKLDGEIDDGELAALEAHLNECEECAEFARRLDQLHELALESSPTPMPAEVQRSILARTSQQTVWWRRLVAGHYRVPRPLAWAAAVALILLAVDAVRKPQAPLDTQPLNNGQVVATQAVQRIVLTESDVVRTYTTQSAPDDL